MVAALAILALTLAISPRAAAAQIVPPGDDPAEDPKCAAGEQLVDGDCVVLTCTPPEEPIGEGGACEKPPLVRCWDGVDRPRGTCPDEPEPAPCPDGAELCGTIRACPTDTPLPPGSACDDPPLETPAPPPVPASPARVGSGTFGRPATVEAASLPGSRQVAVVRAAASREAEPLARTGQQAWLGAVGLVLVAVGWVAVRLGRPPEPGRRCIGE